MRILRCSIFAALVVLTAATAGAQTDLRECELTTTGKIALPDAGGLWYRRVGLVPEYAPSSGGPEWRQVGLYGGGPTARPAAHEAAGLAIAQSIAPIDGEIVMISVGMSNTFQEFGRFQARAQDDAAVSPDLVIVNAAQGGQPADAWDEPDDTTWQRVNEQLVDQGLSADQVQIAWMKHAVRSPTLPPLDFPEHPENLQAILEGIATSLKSNFPNCVLFFVSSRTRAYNTNQSAQSPEPASYEGGFAVQWMLEKQIAGDPSLRYDGIDPPAPWMSWGPYLWTDGLGAAFGDPPSPFDARSDGFVWTCADVDRDGVHPSPPTPDPNPALGEFKVGDMLMAFFRNDAVSAPWFLNSTAGGPALTSLTANGADISGGGGVQGVAPFTVAFAASFFGAAAEPTWIFGDGTFSYSDVGQPEGPYFDENAAPTKIYHVPGDYQVRVSARDAAGNTTLISIPVAVTTEAVATPPALSRGLELIAYPNPFSPRTTFRYELGAPSGVSLEVFDVAGRRVAFRELGPRGAGVHRIAWPALDGRGRKLAPGSYFARISAGDRVGTVRVSLLP